jgi:hypothetical protein
MYDGRVRMMRECKIGKVKIHGVGGVRQKRFYLFKKTQCRGIPGTCLLRGQENG